MTHHKAPPTNVWQANLLLDMRPEEGLDKSELSPDVLAILKDIGHVTQGGSGSSCRWYVNRKPNGMIYSISKILLDERNRISKGIISISFAAVVKWS